MSLGKVRTLIKATIQATVNQIFTKQSENLKETICDRFTKLLA